MPLQIGSPGGIRTRTTWFLRPVPPANCATGPIRRFTRVNELGTYNFYYARKVLLQQILTKLVAAEGYAPPFSAYETVVLLLNYAAIHNSGNKYKTKIKNVKPQTQLF